MSIVSDLTKERYSIKESNPIRADKVIPVLLSEAKELAKRSNREVSKEDIEIVAKSYVKKLESTMKAYEGLPSSGPLEQIKKEIMEFKTFLPKMKTEQETREYFAKVLGLGKVESNAHMGKLLKDLPGDYDKGLASKILKELM